MRVQVAWAAVVVLLQVLGCCWAFGSYPGTFYQMMLRLNKERKYARTAPSPSRLWAIFNPAATLGSLSHVPLDSNRVVRRDLEPRQVQQPSTQRPAPPAEDSRPLSGNPGLPDGESQPTTEVPEQTNGGSATGSGASEPTESTTGVSTSISGGLAAESERGSGRPNVGLETTSSQPVTEISEDTKGESDAIIGESETTRETPNPTEVSEAINEESDSADEELNGGLSNATESVTGGVDTTTGESEPVTEESPTTNEGLEPTSNEGEKVACGQEMVMPAPPASLSPTQGFTLKQNLSTPGWDEGRYPEDLECVWSLKVGPECEVGLLLYQVLQGEVLESPRCTGDYLEFLQPNSHATRYCGPLVNNRDKVSGIDSWHSSQERTTVIRFRSEIQRSLQDRSISGSPRGFLMEVTYYCWLYNKEVAASTRENEVSAGGDRQQHDGGRTEGSAEGTLENKVKESEESEQVNNSQEESLI